MDLVVFFAEAFERYRIPEEILTDNGKVVTNRLGLRPIEVFSNKIRRETRGRIGSNWENPR